MKVLGLQRDSPKSAANRATSSLIDRLNGSYQRRALPVHPDEPDLVVQWGFKPDPGLLSAISAGIPYLIIDLGYIDNGRAAKFSISFNGFHGTAWSDPKVLDREPRPMPGYSDWRSGEGDKVVVVGQMPNDQSLRGQDINAWMGRAASAARDAFGKPVIKRPHPKMLNPWEPANDPWSTALEEAYAVVTWTSTAAIGSVLAGVPTIAMHPGNMAYKVAAHDMILRTPPGRSEWLHELAWREWDFSSSADLDRLADYIIEVYPRLRDTPLDSPRNVL
jgi:hypothetical protein